LRVPAWISPLPSRSGQRESLLDDDRRLDPAWLKRVRPRLVVIAGTQHGPSSETIQALEKAGIPWKSIHRDGPIVVTSDGRDFQVQSGNEAERGLRRKPG